MSKFMTTRFALAAAVCLAAVAFVARFQADRRVPKDDDARIVALLDKPGAMEVLSWLEEAPSGSRIVGGGEKEYDTPSP